MAGGNTINIVLHGEDKASGAIGRVGGALSKFGKVAVAGLGLATAAAGAAAAGIVALGMSAEPLAGLQDAFNAVAADFEGGGAAMLKALQEGSKGLVTNRDLMTSYNKAAALVSKDFANILPDAMGLVQKAAVATGQDVGFLLDSLVTGVGRVSPMILDNLGIQVTLAEVTERSAEMFGAQAEEMGKAGQQAALQAIVMEKLGAVYGDVPDPTMTLARIKIALSNMKDEIALAVLPAAQQLGEVFLGLMETILPTLRSGITKLADGLARGAVYIGEFVTEITKGEGPMAAFMGLLRNIGVSEGVRVFLYNLIQALAALIQYIRWVLVDGDYLNDWLTHLPEPIQGVVQFFGELIVAVQSAVAGFQWAISEGFDPFSAALIAVGEFLDDFIPEGLMNVIWEIINAVIWLKDTIIETVPQFTSWKDLMASIVIVLIGFKVLREITSKVKLFTTAIKLAGGPLSAIVGVLGGPLTLALGAVALVVGLLYLAWQNNWFGIRQVVEQVIGYVKPFIENAIQSIRQWWEEHGEEILAKAQEVWEGIKEAVRAAIEFVQRRIQEIIAIIQEQWEEHGASILASAREIWEAIRAKVEEVINAVQDIIETVSNAIQEFWEAHGETISQMASDVWEAIKGFVEDAFEVIDELFQAFAALFKGDWEGFGEELYDLWEAAWGLITDFLGGLWDAVLPFLTELFQSMITWFVETDWADLGKKIIDGIIDGIVNAASALYNTIKGIIQGALGSGEEEAIADSPAKLFVPLGESLVLGVIAGVQNMAGALYDAFAKLLDGLTGPERIQGFLDAANALMSPLGTFMNVYQQRVLAPAQQTILGLEEQMQALRPEQLAALLGMDVRHLQRITPEMLAHMEATGYYRITPQVREYLELMWQRNEAQEEYQELMERVTKMQEAQMDLQFLTAQLDLIALIKEAGLDVGEVLGGIKLGLDADIPSLVDALALAIQRLIEGASNNLKKAQYGASWLVGGHGGPDSELVQFMASPGERVMVMPPGRAHGTGPQTVNYFQLTANYRYQDERSARDDLETLAMLYGGS